MPTRSLLTFLVVTMCLVACQSTQQADTEIADIKPLLKDELFPSYSLFNIESEEEVFYLGEEAKRFAEQSVYDSGLNARNISGFVSAILDYSDNGMMYRNNANTVANTTFSNRAANCLSLSIMTFALAQHLGLNTTFYEVDIPEYWTRRDGFSLLNGHINLRVSAPETTMGMTIGATYADVDFDPQAIRSHFPRIPVSKKSVLAMFYNNKGADAFVANSYTRAYRYFRAAAKVDPKLQQTWTNLGVLYRMQGDFEQAERTYEHALSLDSENLTVWENLAILYRYQNKEEKAAELFSKIETKRKNNPFYHYILGEQSFEDDNFDKALAHYERAIRLDRKNHEVLFGLAKTYFELGDTTNAVFYLKSAEEHATDDYTAKRYASKLAVLAKN